MRQESWLYRLLRWLGLIQSSEVGKQEMCKQAQSVCNRNCGSCAWNSGG